MTPRTDDLHDDKNDIQETTNKNKRNRVTVVHFLVILAIFPSNLTFLGFKFVSIYKSMSESNLNYVKLQLTVSTVSGIDDSVLERVTFSFDSVYVSFVCLRVPVP